MSRHYEHTVVVVRPAVGEDEYGNEREDWGAGARRTTVSGVNVQPTGASEEDQQDRQMTVTGWRLSTPRGMDLDLRATDRVEYDGMLLEVAGKVGRWRVAGRVHHVEAELKEVD